MDNIKQIILSIVAGGTIIIGGSSYYAVTQEQINQLQAEVDNKVINVDDVKLPKGQQYEKDYIDVRCYKSDRIICKDIYSGKEVMNADSPN